MHSWSAVLHTKTASKKIATSACGLIEKNILFYYLFHEFFIRAKLSISQTVAAQSVTDIDTPVPFRNSAFNGPRGQSITEAIP